jgi:VCBS repeat protein/FG-GAP repeat protein
MRRVCGTVGLVMCSAILCSCAGVTEPATQVGATSARLAAQGRTDASPGHYEFQYATSASLLGTLGGFSTPVRGPIPAHVPPAGLAAFGEQVKALRPSTTYSYRVCGGDAQVHPDACAATRSFTTPAGAPVVDFAPALGAGPGTEVEVPGVAVADLNRDGNLDLAFTGRPGPPDLSVQLGDGAGGFGAIVPVPLPAGTDLSDAGGIAARDLDHDGKPDLAVGVATGVAVLRGDGAGGFGPATTIPVDGPVSQLVARDVDRDGNVDLVALAGAHFVVLRGSAGGTFTAGPDVDAAEAPARFALGDLDHDGIADLVTATTASPGVSVLRGTGTGAFGAPAHTAVPGADPGDVVLGDLDRDGNPDAVVAGTNEHPAPASFLRGDGHGGLGAPVTIPNAPVAALALADFDGDGRLDLAGGAQVDANLSFGKIRVMPGNGDGSFQTPNDFSYNPDDIGEFYVLELDQTVAADLFRDGRPSLVTVGRTARTAYAGLVSVLRTTFRAR